MVPRFDMYRNDDSDDYADDCGWRRGAGFHYFCSTNVFVVAIIRAIAGSIADHGDVDVLTVAARKKWKLGLLRVN